MKDFNEQLVFSEDRADTMATYLEQVQWCERPATVVDSPMLGHTLPVSLERFTIEEVRAVLVRLRNNKAPGPDGIPPECWKVLAHNAEALQEIADFVNECWRLKRIPAEWHLAHVSAIYKSEKVFKIYKKSSNIIKSI